MWNHDFSEHVLCDHLCFVVNKFGHTDAKTLKSALFDFYSSEVLCAAKMRLVDYAVKINLESILPHIPRRRDGDGRLQKEVDVWLSDDTYMSR